MQAHSLRHNIAQIVHGVPVFAGPLLTSITLHRLHKVSQLKLAHSSHPKHWTDCTKVTSCSRPTTHILIVNKLYMIVPVPAGPLLTSITLHRLHKVSQLKLAHSSHPKHWTDCTKVTSCSRPTTHILIVNKLYMIVPVPAGPLLTSSLCTNRT